MNHEPMKIFTIMLISLIMFLAACSDKNVEKGKDFMSIGDYDAAQKEFKIALKNDSGNKTAQQWYIFAYGIQKPRRIIDILNSVPDLSLMLNTDYSGKLPSEDQRAQKEFFQSMRKEFYDKGIETADPEALVELLVDTAELIFDNDKLEIPDSVTNAAAFALAWNGSSSAQKHLINGLKGTAHDDVYDQILRLGPKAAKELQDVVGDENHLAREEAMKALSWVRLFQAAGELFDDYDDIGTEDISSLDSSLRSSAVQSILRNTYDKMTPGFIEWGKALPSEVGRRSLRPAIAYVGGSSETAVFIISGMTPDKVFHSVPFLFHKGKLFDLAVIRGHHKSKNFAGYAPVLKITYVTEGSFFALYSPVNTGGKAELRLMKAKLNVDDETLAIDPSMDLYADSLTDLVGRKMNSEEVAAEKKRLEQFAEAEARSIEKAKVLAEKLSEQDQAAIEESADKAEKAHKNAPLTMISVSGVPDIKASADSADTETAKSRNNAGMKVYKEKNYTEAKRLFIQGLQANPAAHLIRYNLACTYALSGESEKAIGLLQQFRVLGCEKCLEMLNKAKSDEDFSSVRNDERFQKIINGD